MQSIHINRKAVMPTDYLADLYVAWTDLQRSAVGPDASDHIATAERTYMIAQSIYHANRPLLDADESDRANHDLYSL